MGSDGNYSDILHMPGGGCAVPITRDNVDQNLNTLHMNGRETFKQAVISMMRAANIVLDRCGITSAAAVAIALDEAARIGRFHIGDPILLVVFGGGLTYASAIIEW